MRVVRRNKIALRTCPCVIAFPFLFVFGISNPNDVSLGAGEHKDTFYLVIRPAKRRDETRRGREEERALLVAAIIGEQRKRKTPSTLD